MFPNRTVALKTLIQPKAEATEVHQIKQNFEEASDDDDEEIGAVENRPPPDMVLPHMPKVRVKIPDILPMVRKLGGFPNIEQIIVYEQEMSKSMIKERRSTGLKRSLSSRSAEDPDQPGTSHSIGQKKKLKRGGQQNKTSIDMKPKKKEIQLDTRNFSSVLNDAIPPINYPDVTNTSFRGRGHYSIIDSADTNKDDFICVECPPGRGESQFVTFQGKALFNWHMLIKHKTVMEESKEIRTFMTKQSRTSLAAFVFKCGICCRQFDDFNISVSERACQWQVHRMSEHGDEDPPQGNIADIVSRIENGKAHPLLSIIKKIKKEEPHISDNEQTNDNEWTGNGNQAGNIKNLDLHKNNGPPKKKMPNPSEKRKIKREPSISPFGPLKKTKIMASNGEIGKAAEEQIITNLEIQNKEDGKNGQNQATINIAQGSRTIGTDKRIHQFLSQQVNLSQQARIVIVAEEPQQEVEDDYDVRTWKAKGHKPKKQTQKRKSKAEDKSNFKPRPQNFKIADLQSTPFASQQPSTSASSLASSSTHQLWKCQYCAAKFDQGYEFELHISSSHLAQFIRSTKKYW